LQLVASPKTMRALSVCRIYRMSVSQHRDRSVLKSPVLFVSWVDKYFLFRSIQRAARLLRLRGERTPRRMHSIMENIERLAEDHSLLPCLSDLSPNQATSSDEFNLDPKSALG
jgi:hypothetical protein